MELTAIRIQKSPLAEGRLRLVGTVAYDDQVRPPEEYWFDVPERQAASLSVSGNPWAVVLLPLAITLGEPLRLALPVDGILLENLQELQRIWACWYPHLRPVPLNAAVSDPTQRTDKGRTAAFFSGGVDSWFTVLSHSAPRIETKTGAIDDLLCVWGFDVPVDSPDTFREMRTSLQQAANDLGMNLVDVATNLRATRWRQANWALLSHGAGLASIALTLEDRYARVLVGSTGDYNDLTPWGSHILTDPLFSTRKTAIIYDGAAFNRVKKTELVATSDLALRSLRVCWKSRGYQNCCACEKCFRTMLALELLGALERCSTFSPNALDLKAVQRIYLTPHFRRSEYDPLVALAQERGRPDIAAAIGRAAHKSERFAIVLNVLEKLKHKPLVWRLAAPLQRELLARRFT